MFGAGVLRPLGLPGGCVLLRRKPRPAEYDVQAFVDLTDALAMIFVPGYDLGLAGESGYRIACRDSNGRAALGFAGAAGIGAEPGLDVERVVNGDFSAWTGDDPDGWSVPAEAGGYYVSEDSGKLRFVSDGTNFGINQGNILTQDGLYQYSANVSACSGSLLFLPLTGAAYDAWDAVKAYQGYFAAVHAGIYLKRGGAVDITLDDLSIKRVTNPGAEGLTIYQDKELSARGWAWVDPSFDPNDIEKVIMDRTPDLRLLQVGVDLGGPAPDTGAGGVTFSPGDITKETITPTGLSAVELFKHKAASAGFPAYQLAGNFDQAAGQGMMLVVPGLSSAELLALADPGYNQIISLDGTPSSLLYQYVNSGFGYDSVARSYDGTGSTWKASAWAANDPLFLVVQWWDAARQPTGMTNPQGKRVSVATIAAGVWSVSWSSDVAYDGAFSAGSLIQMFYGNASTLHWDHLFIDAEPQTSEDLSARINELAPPA